MVIFSKEVGKFFNAVGVPEIKTEVDKRKYSRQVLNSTSYLRAGKFISFVYKGVTTVAFIAKTERAPDGTFVSKGTYNTLVTAFKLNDAADIVLEAFVESLNNNKDKTSSYRQKHMLKTVGLSTIKNLSKFRLWKSFKLAMSLTTILGKDNFRTFIMSKMLNIHELEVKNIEREGGE